MGLLGLTGLQDAPAARLSAAKELHRESASACAVLFSLPLCFWPPYRGCPLCLPPGRSNSDQWPCRSGRTRGLASIAPGTRPISSNPGPPSAYLIGSAQLGCRARSMPADPTAQNHGTPADAGGMDRRTGKPHPANGKPMAWTGWAMASTRLVACLVVDRVLDRGQDRIAAGCQAKRLGRPVSGDPTYQDRQAGGVSASRASERSYPAGVRPEGRTV